MNLRSPFDTVPADARVFPLRKRTKLPATAHGHLNALPKDDFVYLGANYGIALDGKFILVDVDHEDPDWLSKLPQTWTQRSPGGVHRLFRTPPGFRGSNHKIRVGTNGSQRVLGDLKVRGYLVGPGSEVDPDRGRPGGTYAILDARDPVSAPDWLLALAAAPPESNYEHGTTAERDHILIGENDNSLAAIAGALRRQAFSESAITQMLWGVVESGVMEQLPGKEYQPQDVARIARSIARKPIGEADLYLEAPSIICGTEMRLIGPPIRWWVRGFFPCGEPVMIFGKGGVGKSSVGSWLATVVTLLGGRFMFVGVEEPPERFMTRAVLAGAIRERLYSYSDASKIQLPGGLPRLQTELELLGGVDVLYFDSIYSHFEAVAGLNTAERARRCLGPLAEFAQRTGTSTVCVFHENKAGDYLGSVEMVNVARHVLKATRKPSRPLRLDVFKTNIPGGDPNIALQLLGDDIEVIIDGETQLEEQEDGSYAALQMKVLRRGEDISVVDPLVDDIGPSDLPSEREIEERLEAAKKKPIELP